MIHAVKRVSGEIEIWSDTEAGDFDGRCIGVGETIEEAKLDATKELLSDVAQISMLTDKDLSVEVF